VLDAALLETDGKVFAAHLSRIDSHDVTALRLGKKTEALTRTGSSSPASWTATPRAPTSAFSEVEVDQARAAGVVIEFERYAELAVMPRGGLGRRFRLVGRRGRRARGQRVGLERNPVGAPDALYCSARLSFGGCGGALSGTAEGLACLTSYRAVSAAATSCSSVPSGESGAKPTLIDAAGRVCRIVDWISWNRRRASASVQSPSAQMNSSPPTRTTGS
jgi:hypothetical protein